MSLELTLSKPLPLNTRSVVAAMLPRFRCSSQAISRLSSCGNICASCSTCAGFTRLWRERPLDVDDEVEDVLELEPEPEPESGLEEEKYQRRAKKVMSRTAISCGIFRVCSDIVDVCMRSLFFYFCDGRVRWRVLKAWMVIEP